MSIPTLLIPSDATAQTCGSLFKCESSNTCIPRHWECNGRYDCDDRSDEKNCEVSRCSSNEFRCANGQCIDLPWRCDDDEDCDDGSDEVNCSKYIVDENLSTFYINIGLTEGGGGGGFSTLLMVLINRHLLKISDYYLR